MKKPIVVWIVQRVEEGYFPIYSAFPNEREARDYARYANNACMRAKFKVFKAREIKK